MVNSSPAGGKLKRQKAKGADAAYRATSGLVALHSNYIAACRYQEDEH